MGLDAHVLIHTARPVSRSERLGFTESRPRLEDVCVCGGSANTVCRSDEHAGNVSGVCRAALSAAARFTIHHHIRTGTITFHSLIYYKITRQICIHVANLNK